MRHLLKSYNLLWPVMFFAVVFSQCTKNETTEFSIDINGNILLPTQKQVDSFSNAYRRYNAININGSLVIGGLSNSDVNNTSQLIKIKSVNGDLGILGTGLSSLSGLGRIKSVNNLYISVNRNLVDLDGLDSLKTINGFLYIESNDKLRNLKGLQNLEQVKGSLKFTNGFFGGSQPNNPVLYWINLPALKSIGGDFDLNNIKSVTSFNLPKLDSVKGNLIISHAEKITDFTGFESLKHVGGEFFVSESLVNSFKGFNNLVSVGGAFRIYSNPNISNLNGFNNLYQIGSYIQIIANNNLVSLDGCGTIRIATQINVEHNHNLRNFCGIKELIKNLLVLYPTASPFQLIVLYINSDTLPNPYHYSNILADCP